MKHLLVAGALVLLAACGSKTGGSPGAIDVRVTDAGCDPATIETEAGKVTFNVRNTGTKTAEFEILQGTTVVDERENLTPGLSASMTVDLKAGTYETLCHDDAPKGRITVK